MLVEWLKTVPVWPRGQWLQLGFAALCLFEDQRQAEPPQAQLPDIPRTLADCPHVGGHHPRENCSHEPHHLSQPHQLLSLGL